MQRLKNIAEVQIGYQATGRMMHHGDGTHRLIQLKDVRGDRIQTSDLIAFVPKRDPQPYLVGPGDILFVARGRKNQAVLSTERLENVLAVSNFYIIRAGPAVLPEYLCWHLGQPAAQDHIRSRVHGSGIKMIKKSDLLELLVPVPPLDVQRKVVAVARLAGEEERLTQAISNKRQELAAALCGRAVADKEE